MSEAVTSTFPSVAGQALEYMTWYPQGEAKAIVQLVHGMAEHIARYDEVAKALAKAGYLVVGHTHLGHGKLGDTLGYFGDTNGWDTLLQDVHTLRENTQKEYPKLPYFLLGHSMGSFLTRCYLADHSQGLNGAIISGTGYYAKEIVAMGAMLCKIYMLFGQGKRPAKLIDTIAFSGGNKQFKDAKTAYDWLSRDEHQVRLYIDDPFCGYPFTALGYRDLFTGLKRLSQQATVQKVDKALPLYFLSGGRDPIGENGIGVKRVAQQFIDAGNKSVTVKLYPDGRHEMFNELNKEVVYQDLISWVDAHNK